MAAAANANSAAGADYVMSKVQSLDSTIKLTVATAAQIAKVGDSVPKDLSKSAGTSLQDSIVDTTGAGDAFIASLLYGIVNKLSLNEMLSMAGAVAACKCTEIGARAGQPTLKDIKLPQSQSISLS